jgi:hypothetical protein
MHTSSLAYPDSRSAQSGPRKKGSAVRGLTIVLAACLILGWALPAVAQTKSSDKGAKGQKAAPRAVLVFPTDTKGGTSDQIVDMITDVVQGRLAASDRYHSVYFLSSLPTIRRALTEATLSQTDVKNPFDNDTKVKKVARIAGYDMALVTSIDDYQYDAAKNQVSMVMSARLVDVAGGNPRAAAESGTSSLPAPKSATELTLAEKVSRDLTEKLMTALLGTPKPSSTDTDMKGKRPGKKGK